MKKATENTKTISRKTFVIRLRPRKTLYRIFSTQGNPKLKSLISVLHSVGLKLSVEVEKRISASA